MQGISVRTGLSYRKKKVLSGARGLQEARATALRQEADGTKAPFSGVRAKLSECRGMVKNPGLSPPQAWLIFGAQKE